MRTGVPRGRHAVCFFSRHGGLRCISSMYPVLARPALAFCLPLSNPFSRARPAAAWPCGGRTGKGILRGMHAAIRPTDVIHCVFRVCRVAGKVCPAQQTSGKDPFPRVNDWVYASSSLPARLRLQRTRSMCALNIGEHKSGPEPNICCYPIPCKSEQPHPLVLCLVAPLV